jgi:hypothetical protein
LRGLSQLQQRIARADAGGLSAIRAEVAASVAATQTLVQQTQMGAASAQSAQVTLRAASEAARGSVTSFMRDYYDDHVFDRYLRFASVQDEEEYRRREEQRHRAIDEAHAEKTPQGDLRALDLSIEQLKDAGEHGARRSSKYQPLLDRMESSRQQLATQMAAAGQSQSHGAATADNLSPPVRSGPSDGKSSDATPQAPLPPDVLARLRAAQVTVADQSQEGHGVTARTTPAPDARGL